MVKLIPIIMIFCAGMAYAAQSEKTAFKIGIELPSQTPVSGAVEATLKDIGIGYINYYVNTSPWGNDSPANETNQAMLDLCDRLQIDFSIACHAIDPPDDVVIEAIRRGGIHYRGVVIDELEHCRLLNNYSPTMLVDTSKFQTLEQAYNETLTAFTKLRSKYAELGSPATSTHIWPLMNDIAARAGFTVCPKICKEVYSPMALAMGIGAAKQYGRDLWVDCDLWFYDLIPGHSPEEMKSNLLLAYWLGADLVYVEGCGFNLKPAGRQGIPFSLMAQIDQDTYQLTAHGEVLRDFCKNYLPMHPRPYTFRDIIPNIAIIRFEDTCHGQRYSSDWKDHLYGSPNLQSNRDTEAWLGLWNLLTFGKTGRDGISLFKSYTNLSGYEKAVQEGLAPSYLTRPVQADQHRFFAPLNGVVAYDHTVEYDLLKDIPLLFLTGTQVSNKTTEAIKRRIDEGAICVAWGPLAVKCGLSDWESGVVVKPQGKGKLILTDDFGYTQVIKEVWPLLGRPDEIHYRFGKHDVVLRRVTDNEVKVELKEL